MAKVKKTLALEIISFKHPQTNDTALVRTAKPTFTTAVKTTAAMITSKTTTVHTETTECLLIFFVVFETWSQSEQPSRFHVYDPYASFLK